jgi:hypothetical protein
MKRSCCERLSCFLQGGSSWCTDNRLQCKQGKDCIKDPKGKINRSTLEHCYVCPYCPECYYVCSPNCLTAHFGLRHADREKQLTSHITPAVESKLLNPKRFHSSEYSKHTYFLAKGYIYLLQEVQQGAGTTYNTYSEVPAAPDNELTGLFGYTCSHCTRVFSHLVRIKEIGDLRDSSK